MKPSLSYHIDITGSCNLSCPSCSMGRGEAYPKHIMSENELGRILAKAMDESYPLGVWLYNYTEPFVHPRLHEMVKVVRSFGLPAYISTNLNIRRNIEEVLEAGPEVMMVSVSGFTQEVYSQTHTGGHIETVKDHIRIASQVPSRTLLRIHWHRYKSNLGEEVLMRQFVSEMPKKWDFHSYKAVRIDLEEVLKRFEDGPRNPLEDNLLRDLDQARINCLGRTHYRCQLQDGSVSLNSYGNYKLCGSIYNSHQDLHFLNMCVSQWLEHRRESTACTRCMALGGHVYAMELYDHPVHSVRLKLEEAYRAIPMRGKFAPWIAKARNLGLAAKPS